MNHYEEGINAMWEEVEGKKPESIHQPSDKERWKEFVEKYSHMQDISMIVKSAIVYPENKIKIVLIDGTHMAIKV